MNSALCNSGFSSPPPSYFSLMKHIFKHSIKTVGLLAYLHSESTCLVWSSMYKPLDLISSNQEGKSYKVRSRPSLATHLV